MGYALLIHDIDIEDFAASAGMPKCEAAAAAAAAEPPAAAPCAGPPAAPPISACSGEKVWCACAAAAA